MNRQLLHPFLLLILVICLLVTRSVWTETKLEYLLAVAGIFFTGIPHGAMDHHTASFLNGSRFQLIRYLLQYLFSAFLYLAVWFLFPGLAFLLFLVFTAWHFGETDLACFQSKNKSGFLVFFYGWCLLMWLLLKEQTVILYWTNIITSNHELSNQFIQWLTAIPHGLWFILSAGILLFTVYTEPEKWLGAGLFLLFTFGAAYTSLLLGFVVYFAGWHSLQALHHLRTSVFQGADLKKLIGKALPAVIGSLFIFLFIIKFGNGGWVENKGLPSLFILLAVLTLPHMAQMHQLYQFRSR